MLESSFIEMGLEVYSQNYTARRRAVLRHGDPASLSGRNVYGILRAGRASSAESLVFSCPTGEDGPNTHGLAVMLSLAEYFKSELHNYTHVSLCDVCVCFSNFHFRYLPSLKS